MLLITDLDNTLCDARWRDHLKPDWDAYYKASIEDAAFWTAVQVVNSLWIGHWNIVCVTSRPEKWRQLTMEWLIKWTVKVNELIMRPDDNFDRSPELKLKLIEPLRRQWTSIVAIDDREDVVAAYAAEGITAFHSFATRLP